MTDAHDRNTGGGLNMSSERRAANVMLEFLYGAGPNADGLWFDEVAHMERGQFWWRNHLREVSRLHTAEVEALRKENERLKEALRPLAAVVIPAKADDDAAAAFSLNGLGDPGGVEITVGDVRRARAEAMLKEAVEVACQIEIDRGDKNGMPSYAAAARVCRDAILARITQEGKE